MPRRLEIDRWLFGVTVALCLFGAVMIFSASAVTAEKEFGHGYYFLVRQIVSLVVGLAWYVCLDAHGLPAPPRTRSGLHDRLPCAAPSRRNFFSG